ncbi:65-kDa microtubule-associated protein 5 isoform X2 [Malania oleifera]|nr:65-kDa microtubule-associated protein 5 isoform X2 [Malania oleifera]
MLLQLEQECLDIYRKKVEKSRKYKADLHQALAEAEAEVANIVAALGEGASFSREKGTLKEQIAGVKPILGDLRLKKQERLKEFSETQSQIIGICAEIAGNSQFVNSTDTRINEQDLSMKKLGELKSHLQELQNEKALRLQKVNSHVNTIHELSDVMSLDFNNTMVEVHPSFGDATVQSKNISNDTLARSIGVINSLKQEKQQRLQKLQDLGRTLIELWNLMDTPVVEQKKFDNVTCLISSSVDEVSTRGCLALDVVEQTEVEVERLNSLKASKMKDLVLKRQNELEEIYRSVHVDVDSETAQQILISLIESGNVDLSDLLSGMDDQITKAKEQASSRKDILEKVDKWKYASEEENWLDEYERDDNRYSAGRGAHKNLKRAEKARILVGKIPSLVENLSAKVKAWEIEKGIPFLYDKVPLLQTLEVYTAQRHEREEEKRRSREQKRLQEQLTTEQEALFGSRPTIKKPLGQSIAANTTIGTPVGRRALTPSARHGISGGGKERRDSGKLGTVIPVNYVALTKDDSLSQGN